MPGAAGAAAGTRRRGYARTGSGDTPTFSQSADPMRARGGRKVRGTGPGSIPPELDEDEIDRIMRETEGRNYERADWNPRNPRGKDSARRHRVVGRAGDLPPGTTPGQLGRAGKSAGRRPLMPLAARQMGVPGAALSVDDGAGFILGCIAFALGRAYLTGGPTLARQWLAAKFLNRAGTSTGSASSPPAKTTPTAPGAPSTTTTRPTSRVPGGFSTTPPATTRTGATTTTTGMRL